MVWPMGHPALSPAVLEERRALLKHAYDEGPHPNACWARRWPVMSVMAGCGFSPLAVRLLEQEMHLAALLASGEVAPPSRQSPSTRSSSAALSTCV